MPNEYNSELSPSKDIVERSMVTITKERYDFHVAEIERLREGLEFYSCDCPIDDEDNCELGDWGSLSCGYRARKALEGKG